MRKTTQGGLARCMVFTDQARNIRHQYHASPSGEWSQMAIPSCVATTT